MVDRLATVLTHKTPSHQNDTSFTQIIQNIHDIIFYDHPTSLKKSQGETITAKALSPFRVLTTSKTPLSKALSNQETSTTPIELKERPSNFGLQLNCLNKANCKIAQYVTLFLQSLEDTDPLTN
jgi:hypothetical protein